MMETQEFRGSKVDADHFAHVACSFLPTRSVLSRWCYDKPIVSSVPGAPSCVCPVDTLTMGRPQDTVMQSVSSLKLVHYMLLRNLLGRDGADGLMRGGIERLADRLDGYDMNFVKAPPFA